MLKASGREVEAEVIYRFFVFQQQVFSLNLPYGSPSASGPVGSEYAKSCPSSSDALMLPGELFRNPETRKTKTPIQSNTIEKLERL